MSIDTIIFVTVIGSIGAVIGFMIALIFVNLYLRKDVNFGGFKDGKSND